MGGGNQVCVPRFNVYTELRVTHAGLFGAFIYLEKHAAADDHIIGLTGDYTTKSYILAIAHAMQSA